jgi:Zn-dependent M28 family amino/carboxypeptidase
MALTGAGAMATTALTAQVRFDGDRAFEDLRRQVECGPRPSGSAALEECRRYLLAQLEAAGIAVRQQPFTAATPLGPVRMTNLIATIPGRRPERIALGTHYDTKLFTDIRFVGASDGASSTAAVLELGRALRREPLDYTVELIFFDGEEALVEWSATDSRYGSRHYVQAAQQDGTLAGLKALVLLDMVGDRELTIRREAHSTRWLNDLIWAAAARLGHTSSFLPGTQAVEDDHLPFLAAGIPAVDIIDFQYDAWHTAGDTLERVSPRSLRIVGEVVLAALPEIARRLDAPPRRVGF